MVKKSESLGLELKVLVWTEKSGIDTQQNKIPKS